MRINSKCLIFGNANYMWRIFKPVVFGVLAGAILAVLCMLISAVGDGVAAPILLASGPLSPLVFLGETVEAFDYPEVIDYSSPALLYGVYAFILSVCREGTTRIQALRYIAIIHYTTSLGMIIAYMVFGLETIEGYNNAVAFMPLAFPGFIVLFVTVNILAFKFAKR